MVFRMAYRGVGGAPEDVEVSAVWGLDSKRPEYGPALRLGGQWFIYGQANPHANGRPCDVPDGWLPKDSKDWTGAERTLCDILALHPELTREGSIDGVADGRSAATTSSSQ
jgi:hypothetical protein